MFPVLHASYRAALKELQQIVAKLLGGQINHPQFRERIDQHLSLLRDASERVSTARETLDKMHAPLAAQWQEGGEAAAAVQVRAHKRKLKPKGKDVAQGVELPGAVAKNVDPWKSAAPPVKEDRGAVDDLEVAEHLGDDKDP